MLFGQLWQWLRGIFKRRREPDFDAELEEEYLDDEDDDEDDEAPEG